MLPCFSAPSGAVGLFNCCPNRWTAGGCGAARGAALGVTRRSCIVPLFPLPGTKCVETSRDVARLRREYSRRSAGDAELGRYPRHA